jgi:predicted Rossmann-fold nucleotide-binding protein
MRITCFGSGKDIPNELYEEMKSVGRMLAARGISVATGAFGGIGMQAAPEEASRNGGRAIGYTYQGKRANPFITETVDCQKLTQHIPFDADYCVRLAGLLSSDAFIVAAGGGPGTFHEFIATINFNQKFWKPMKRTAVLERRGSGRLQEPAWNQSMLAQLRHWGVLNDEVAKSIRVVDSAEKAILWVCDGVES